MPKNPARLFKTKDNYYAIAYNKDQLAKYSNDNKVLVKIFEDENCNIPLLKDDKEVNSILNLKGLKFLGFLD